MSLRASSLPPKTTETGPTHAVGPRRCTTAPTRRGRISKPSTAPARDLPPLRPRPSDGHGNSCGATRSWNAGSRRRLSGCRTKKAQRRTGQGETEPEGSTDQAPASMTVAPLDDSGARNDRPNHREHGPSDPGPNAHQRKDPEHNEHETAKQGRGAEQRVFGFAKAAARSVASGHDMCRPYEPTRPSPVGTGRTTACGARYRRDAAIRQGPGRSLTDSLLATVRAFRGR